MSVSTFLCRWHLETLIYAVITSCLGYCNSLLIRISQAFLFRQQLVQNAAARSLTGTSKRGHITPVLVSLHWFLVKFWIHFKIIYLFLSVLIIFVCAVSPLHAITCSKDQLTRCFWLSQRHFTNPEEPLKFSLLNCRITCLWRSGRLQPLLFFKTHLKIHVFSLTFYPVWVVICVKLFNPCMYLSDSWD